MATLITFLADNYRSAKGSARRDIVSGHAVLDMALTETAVFAGILPAHYAGGGITVYLHFAMSSAVANNIKLETSFEKVASLGTDSFATARNSGDVAVPATANTPAVVSITHTNAQIDGIAAGDYILVKVGRVAATSSDASGDLELIAVELRQA